jgi:hypothetical protein
MADMVRKHFTLPRELAEEFERVVGERNQSAEVAAMMERRVKHERLREAFENLANAPKSPHPEWDTAEARAKWIADMRKSRDIDELFDRG